MPERNARILEGLDLTASETANKELIMACTTWDKRLVHGDVKETRGLNERQYPLNL